MKDSKKNAISLAYTRYKEGQENKRKAVLKSRFGNEPWLQKLAWLHQSAFNFSFIIQAISVFGALFGAYWLIDHLMPHPILSIVAAATVFYFVEKWKRKSSDAFWDTFWKDGTISTGWLVFSILLFVISVASSGVGTWKAVYAIDNGPEVIENDSTLIALQKEQAALATNMAASRKTTWKGRITRESQKAMTNYSEFQKLLYADVQKRGDEINTQNSELTQAHESNLLQIAIITLFIYLFLELIFEACMGFCSFYDFELYLAQNESIEKPKNEIAEFKNNYNGNVNIPTPELNDLSVMNGGKRKIGFQLNSETTVSSQPKQLFRHNSKQPTETAKQLVAQASQPVLQFSETAVSSQQKQSETVVIISSPSQDVSKWRRYANTYYKRSQKTNSLPATRQNNYNTYLEYKELLEATGKYQCKETNGQLEIIQS